MTQNADYALLAADHLRQMEAWQAGLRSHQNTYHNCLTPDQIALMDTLEIVGHAACAQAYSAAHAAHIDSSGAA